MNRFNEKQLDNKVNYITSLSQYIDALNIKIQKLGNDYSVWFRGLGSEEFGLFPNLYRETVFQDEEHQPELSTLRKIYSIEQNIDVNFSRKSTIFFANKNISDTP